MEYEVVVITAVVVSVTCSILMNILREDRRFGIRL